MHLDPAATLRSHGMPVTAQRLAVLRAVNRHPHATADQVAAAATKDIGSISRQSVYDTLSSMVERGVLRKIQPVGSVALYEDRVGDNHHHVICRSCGAVADVDCAVGRRPCLDASDTHGFVIDEADVSYWGLCPTCSADARPSSRAAGRAGTSRFGATPSALRSSVLQKPIPTKKGK